MNLFSLEPVKSRARGLARLITWDMGECCPVFLDTSSAIDIERELAHERHNHRSFSPANFYLYLKDALNGRLYVEDCVAQEAVEHSHNYVNGKHELSQETLNIMLLLNQGYNQYLSGTSFLKPLDEIRRDVYWAGFLAFDPEHKKAKCDSISRNDRSLLSAALHARYASESTGAAILSSDSHISETARVLTNLHPQAYSTLCKIVHIDPIDHPAEVNGYNPFDHTCLRTFNTRRGDHA